MATIKLSDSLAGITELGTWTYTGATAPNPVAPGTWDGIVDFTGFADGNYEYTYTVTSLTGCTDISVTVIVLGTSLTLSNDECLGGLSNFLDVTHDSRVYTNQDMKGTCPGTAAATLTATAIPASWGIATYVGDMWYQIDVEVATGTALFGVTVDSSAYAIGEQLINPVIASYTGSCAVLVIEDDVTSTSSTQAIMNNVLAVGSYSYFIRVGGTQNNTGKFTITFTLT